MKINQKFYNDIKPILLQLRNKVGNDFIVFGSTPLFLLGVVEYKEKINDIDIALEDKKIYHLMLRLLPFREMKTKNFIK